MKVFHAGFSPGGRSARVRFAPGGRHGLSGEFTALGVGRALVLTTPQQEEIGRRFIDNHPSQAVGLLADAKMHTPVEITGRRSNFWIRPVPIADVEGDAGAYIDQQSDLARKAPQIAAEIARRLLEAGRVEDAWVAVNAPGKKDRGWIPYDKEVTRISVMQAMAQTVPQRLMDITLSFWGRRPMP